MLSFDFTGSNAHLPEPDRQRMLPRARAAHRALLQGTGAGPEWLGWRRLLAEPDDALLDQVEQVALEIRERADVLVCIGIGGSYLGADAVIQALTPAFPDAGRTPVVFAGHHLSTEYLAGLLEWLKGKSVYVNVISKSGTTLEPALAFRFIRAFMEETFEDADRRIIATTDAHHGALRTLASEKGYRTFTIPGDVGGRFSALTPVGLLPMAAAGIDIRTLFYGSVTMMRTLASEDDNPALEYAMRRWLLHEAGYTTEVLSVMDPRMTRMGAWWQQLFGESEGKNHQGLFPSVCTFTTDLHSVGQFIQEGRRTLIETFLTVESGSSTLRVPGDPADLDGLSYLEGRRMRDVNRAAFEGTLKAHIAGGVPVTHIGMPAVSAESIGQLMYFFEHAIAVMGYLLGVNPFDQPGVEAYKKEMFTALGKPC
ncbi:MAG: glucose-6-phosphate isomerase [Rhodothermales bacterium]